MNKPYANEDDILAMHLKEIKNIPVLENSEEKELAIKAAAGDKVARDKLLTSNMKFVVKIASQYKNRGLEYEDLISEGYMGLIRALEHFDVNKGYHFISYAVWWIRQGILKAILDLGRSIRLPVNKSNEILEVRKIRHQINPNGKKSEEQELEEIALKLGMTKHYIRELISISQEMVSLDAPIGSPNGDGTATLVDVIVQDKSLDDEIEYACMKQDINDVLSTLDKKSATVLNMRYGLNGNSENTLKEVGETLQLSRERVRQIEKHALAKIRENKKCKNHLKDYVA